MTRDEASTLGESITDSHWVSRVAVRENPRARGGYALSVWPGRYGPGVAWSATRNEFNRLYPGHETLRRNRDLAVEKQENALRELW